MKIRKPSFVMTEIGMLDAHLILPTAGRIKRQMKTICRACNQNITEEKFLGGFKAGMPNMLFHIECVPENERGEAVGGANK